MRGSRLRAAVTSADGTMSPRMDFGQRVVDCDIHATVPSVEALLPYLSDHWREYIRTSAFKGATDTAYPPNAPTTRGPGRNGPPDLEAGRRDVLDPWNVEPGILNCSYALESRHHPATPAAKAPAVHD